MKGSCNVLLDAASTTLGFERYLERRIAALCAGSLADCRVRYLGQDAIGDAFYRTLVSLTGKDDFDRPAR